MRNRILLLAIVVACSLAAGAQSVQHGFGDPRTLNPMPNCAASRFYVDDSTGVMYQANQASPCAWSRPGAGSAVPGWLISQGDGNEGAFSCPSGTCNLDGEHWYTSFNVSAGATVAVNSSKGLTIRTPSATINGTIDARGSVCLNALGFGFGGGASGGSGGGTAAGGAGTPSELFNNVFAGGNGAAGASSGGNGGNAASFWSAKVFQAFLETPGTEIFLSGGTGKQGGSTGGAAGNGGCGVVIVAGSLSGSGTIMTDGQYGGASAGNSTGAGSGGGGGPIILSAGSNTSALTLYSGGGTGGPVAVPWAPVNGYGGTGGWLSLTVTAGAVTACAVGGGGTGYPPSVTIPAAYVPVLGGGGSGATVTATTNSSGVVASCAVTAAGNTYTASTSTGAGTGGNGFAGPTHTFTY